MPELRWEPSKARADCAWSKMTRIAWSFMTDDSLLLVKTEHCVRSSKQDGESKTTRLHAKQDHLRSSHARARVVLWLVLRFYDWQDHRVICRTYISNLRTIKYLGVSILYLGTGIFSDEVSEKEDCINWKPACSFSVRLKTLWKEKRATFYYLTWATSWRHGTSNKTHLC